jgi:hypothetical protein
MCPSDLEKVLGGLRIGRILFTGIGGNLGYIRVLTHHCVVMQNAVVAVVAVIFTTF